MFVLDRPLVPKYTKATSLSSVSSTTSGISTASSNLASLKSQSTVTTCITTTEKPPKPNGNTISRANSAASLGRPYQTKTDEPNTQRRKSRSVGARRNITLKYKVVPGTNLSDS